jgi:hypothetical protein
MKPIPAELLAMGILGGAGDDEALGQDSGGDDEPTCLDEFHANAQFAAACGGYDHAARLKKEIALVDARANKIYQDRAAEADAEVHVNDKLEKRAAKIEETEYPSGRKVVAELDENGVCIRTYAVEP